MPAAPRIAFVLGVAICACGLVACSSEEPASAATSSSSSSGSGGGARCPPGTGPADDGSCAPAGVPPEACGAGFAASEGGCSAILPEVTCEEGQMAVPGDTACHLVAPCGPNAYDGIPIDATTQFVDASFSGTSDGTEAAPWTTIGDGIAHATSGGIVAIAAGVYPEEVDVALEPVELWGTCPGEVTIAPSGTDAMTRALTVRGNASGTEVHRVGITSKGIGVGVFGVTDVTLEEVWIHDTGFVGLGVQGTSGTTGATLSRSLIEGAMTAGALAVSDADLAVVESVVRGTRYDGADPSGYALIVEQDAGTVAHAEVDSSVLEKNEGGAVYLQGAAGTIDATVMRDNGSATHAITLDVSRYMDVPASATIRGSVLERNRAVGIVVYGSDAEIETTTVRDVSEDATAPYEGYGVGIKSFDAAEHATVTMRSCLVDRVKQVGVAILGADATIDRTLVRNVTPVEGGDVAFGFDIFEDPDTHAVGTLNLTASAVENAPASGIVVQSSTATIDGLHVTDIAGIDGLFGDGIDVWAQSGAASLTLTHSLVERATRAGVATFGATVRIADTTLECNPIMLDGELDFDLDDQGGNVCGCAGTTQPCKVLSSMLTPPSLPQ